MSSVMRPVGPQRVQTYWRRRVVAVLLLVVLVVGILLIARGCAGAGGSPSPTLSSAPGSSPGGSLSSSPGSSSDASGGASSQSSAPDPATSSSPPDASSSATTSPTASASPTATALPVLLRCEDSAILVEVITDGAEFPVGADVPMEMWVTNVSPTACIRNLGTEANRVVVRNVDLQVWSSTSCEGLGESKDVTLMPSSTYMIPLTWDGRSNYAGCTSSEPTAAAGDYQVSARNGEVTSRSVTFTLRS